MDIVNKVLHTLEFRQLKQTKHAAKCTVKYRDYHQNIDCLDKHNRASIRVAFFHH